MTKQSEMQALRLHATGDIRIHSEARPEPGADEALVRVTAVGLCGSDLHWYEHGGTGTADLSQPLVLGHEIGGFIAEGPEKGLRVALEPADPCGKCEQCRAGVDNLCPNVAFCGHGTVDGGLRTYMAWPRRLLVPVPDSISDDEVTLLEPLGVALNALDLSELEPGMSAGVYGCGPIGLLLTRALRAAGIERIIATDALAHRVDAALVAGAHEAFPTSVDGQPDGLEAWRPADVAFEVAGVDAALETAVRSVRIGGRVVIVGIPGTDQHLFPAGPARRKGLMLVMCRRMRQEHLHRAIDLVADGSIDLSGLISTSVPLDAGPAAFESLRSRSSLKAIVRP